MAPSSPRKMPNPVFHEPIFNESNVLPDPTGFAVPHKSDSKTYDAVEKLLKTQVVGFPASRLDPDGLYPLAEAYGERGADVEEEIRKAGRIVFHVIGDSGAVSGGKVYEHEVAVADQLTADCRGNDAANRPSFLYHLGDVVYNFGEAKYYYDQFYEPFRNYPAPIIAIPGNHDSFVIPGTPEQERPLDVFMRNFCVETPEVSVDAGSLHRTATTAPGVYFALDMPFARVIGLFSNALEDPGVISSEGGRWEAVPDLQLAFLEAQLTKVRDEKYNGAVLLAVHHPPFSYSQLGEAPATHGSSIAMLAQIDEICARVGLYPHAVLSGHAHNYQRYTRVIDMGEGEHQVPFIVCGDGGHHVNQLVWSHKGSRDEPGFGTDVSYLDADPKVNAKGLRLEKYNDRDYGYLRVDVTPDHLAIGYHTVGALGLAQSRTDKVTISLSTRRIIGNG
ncbi:MAG: metallophosphoesterase [Rhodobacteraceae bacterium]|nr:metallophosphoesterase [Paracoccaceae bacterium]